MAHTLKVTSMMRLLGKKMLEVNGNKMRSFPSAVAVDSFKNSPTHLTQQQTSIPNHCQFCLSCLILRREQSTSTNPNGRDKPATSKVLFDGDCKICQIEISALKRWTAKRDNIEFVDISKHDYNPQQWGGVSYEDAMKEMHVVGPDGKVYTEGDAIRHMYRACGLGFLSAFTELPLIRPVCDKLYVHFAKYRLQKALERCDSDSCDIKLKHLRDKLETEKKL